MVDDDDNKLMMQLDALRQRANDCWRKHGIDLDALD